MSFYIKKKNILVSWNEWFSNWIYWILDHFSPSLRNFLNVRIFTLETGPRGNIKFWKTFVANSSSLDISAIVQTNKHTLRNPQGFFRIFSSQFLMFEILWMFFFISSRLLRAYRFSTATARVSVRLKGWAPSEALQSYKSVQCRHPELMYWAVNKKDSDT